MSNVYRIFDYKPKPKVVTPLVEDLKSNLEELQRLHTKLKLMIQELKASVG